LRRIRDARPDLIVSDILMPRMDGWALCEEVRRDPSTRSIPFIFLTTERQVPKRIKGLEMGADDYMGKPFAKEGLVARAARLPRRVQEAGSPRAPSSAMAPGDRLSGHTDHIPMADLLQTLSLNARTGTLHVSGVSVGRIYFQSGRILDAETQGLRREKALFRMMAWPEARFSFDAALPPHQVEAAIQGSTSSVLMEGYAHLDELRDLVATLPKGGQRVRVPAEHRDDLESLQLSTTQRLILFAAGERGS